MKVTSVVGARPNFVKIAPILWELDKRRIQGFPIASLLVHTGQHYDEGMSEIFFRQLDLPQPDVYLGVGSGTHAEQTARIMIEFEKVCFQESPDLVIVVGDVNSTLACALVAAKLCIPLAHVEAGLRSFDRTMPEEVNRVVTDHLADFLFTHSEEANHNLISEGIPAGRIFFVGNIMIDTLIRHRARAEASEIRAKLQLQDREYALLTLHRPSNVDDEGVLKSILHAIAEIQRRLPVVFPVHPRSRKKIEEFDIKNLIAEMSNMILVPPLGYLDFLHLMSHAAVVLSDSGGVQEEATILGVPCLTLRDGTERPVTVTDGTNAVVGTKTHDIIQETFRVLAGTAGSNRTPPMWDGEAAKRIVSVILGWSGATGMHPGLKAGGSASGFVVSR